MYLSNQCEECTCRVDILHRNPLQRWLLSPFARRPLNRKCLSSHLVRSYFKKRRFCKAKSTAGKTFKLFLSNCWASELLPGQRSKFNWNRFVKFSTLAQATNYLISFCFVFWHFLHFEDVSMDQRQTNVNASIPKGTSCKQLSDMFMLVRGRDKEKVSKYQILNNKISKSLLWTKIFRIERDIITSTWESNELSRSNHH